MTQSSGTPHTHHYANTKLALTAHKHVLCEKPFTSNNAELQSLIELSRLNKVFLMEALWTRFQPISLEIKKLVDSEELGEIQAVHATLSADFGIESKFFQEFTFRDLNSSQNFPISTAFWILIWVVDLYSTCECSIYEDHCYPSRFPVGHTP
jgi:predicted dehydrogenase